MTFELPFEVGRGGNIDPVVLVGAASGVTVVSVLSGIDVSG